jgi:hypothetical protein
LAKAKYEAEEPRTPSLLDAPLVIGPEIDKAVPELDAVLGEIATAAGRFIKHAMGQYPGDGPGGIPVVLSQALNDYLDVLFDINAGRGRSALRGARALFELLVTGMDIMTDKTLEQRYMDHESVISQLEAAMEFEADRLPKRPRKEDARRRQRLAKSSQADFASAIEKYGKAFKRRWAPHNLATRARKYGLEKDYDFYRLSSAVLHGSSGGALGIRKVIQDETVHRTGMALLLCPLAFLQALRYFDMLVEAYAKQYSATFTTDLRSAIAEALKLWPKYRRAIHRLDLSLWPKSPPPNLLPYLVATSSPREQKWFIHDPDAGLMIEANPPQYIPEFQEESINATLDEYYKAQPGELEPLSMVVVGVDISPKHGAEWEDDKTVLTRETGYPFK